VADHRHRFPVIETKCSGPGGGSYLVARAKDVQHAG
jgi:hypothetical protein